MTNEQLYSLIEDKLNDFIEGEVEFRLCDIVEEATNELDTLFDKDTVLKLKDEEIDQLLDKLIEDLVGMRLQVIVDKTPYTPLFLRKPAAE